MKRPKSLTLSQKKCLTAHGLNPRKFALVEETEFCYRIFNKESGAITRVDKFRRF